MRKKGGEEREGGGRQKDKDEEKRRDGRRKKNLIPRYGRQRQCTLCIKGTAVIYTVYITQYIYIYEI